MEQNDPSQRQYVPQTYTTQQPQQASAAASGQYVPPGSAERYRQSAYLQESPGAASPAGRPPGDGQQVYGFGQGVQYGVQQSPVQYTQDVQTPQSQRQSAQAYQQYGVYGMPQQATAQSPYEQVSHYRSRTNTVSETYGASFGVPQSAQYYMGGQAAQPSASAAEFTGQQVPSQYMLPDPYQQAGPSSAQSYQTSSMMDPSQSAYPGYAGQPQYSAQQQAPPMEEFFDRYSNQIRTIFTLARDGSLQDVPAQLLSVSQNLLTNAQLLGLTRDDENQHDQRIQLWDEFNRAWLVTLQRQHDLTQGLIQGIQLRDTQSIIAVRDLERMSSELVRLCDSVEKHGLVDYQMGVAEEEIMDLLLRCIALLNPAQGRGDDGDPVAESSAAGASRGR